MADRIGFVSEDREQLAPEQGERLSHRLSLLINLVASLALYGIAFLMLRGIIHWVEGLLAH